MVEVEAAKSQTGPSADEIAALPGIEEQHRHPGKSDCQVKMFRKNGIFDIFNVNVTKTLEFVTAAGKAFAYQWSGPSSTWVEIGEVTGSTQVGHRGMRLSGPVPGRCPGVFSRHRH